MYYELNAFDAQKYRKKPNVFHYFSIFSLLLCGMLSFTVGVPPQTHGFRETCSPSTKFDRPVLSRCSENLWPSEQWPVNERLIMLFMRTTPYFHNNSALCVGGGFFLSGGPLFPSSRSRQNTTRCRCSVTFVTTRIHNTMTTTTTMKRQ